MLSILSKSRKNLIKRKKLAKHNKNQDKAAHLKSLFLQQSFSLKVIFYIGILLFVAIAISFYLTNETHEKEVINLMKLQAHRLTDTIKATIRENMIKHGSHEEIQSSPLAPGP